MKNSSTEKEQFIQAIISYVIIIILFLVAAFVEGHESY